MRALVTTGISRPLLPSLQTSRRTPRCTRCIRHRNRRVASADVVFASIVALGVPIFMAGSASAATRTASSVRVAYCSTYCQLVKGVQSSGKSAFSNLTTPNQDASVIKSAYQNFKSDKSKVFSVVPSQLKATTRRSSRR